MMRQFKTIDIWVSIGLILCSLIISLIKLDATFLICYCVIGGWQLISMGVHIAHGWFKEDKPRIYYYKIVFIFIITALIGIVFNYALLAVLFILLFAAPFMPCYYAWLCYDEVFVKMQRPLAFLK